MRSPGNPGSLRRTPWVGVDVGGDRSTSAVCWIGRQHHVDIEIYHGDAGVLDCVDTVRELAGAYQVREVVFDPWRFGQAAQELERERIVVTAFPQTGVRIAPPPTASTAAFAHHARAVPTLRP